MLKTGLLWFDDNPQRPFDAKLERAVAYYAVKYGQPPNVCYVHPTCLPQASPVIAAVEVRAAQDILPHHFMLGVARVAD
jgi:hypothetical protein